MVGRVEGVGCEDEVEGLRRLGFVIVIIPIIVVHAIIVVVVIRVSKGAIGIEIRPIERGGSDGAARG